MKTQFNNYILNVTCLGHKHVIVNGKRVRKMMKFSQEMNITAKDALEARNRAAALVDEEFVSAKLISIKPPPKRGTP